MSPPRRRRDDHRRVCRRHACRRGLRRRAHRRREVRHGAGGTGSDHPDGAEHGLRCGRRSGAPGSRRLDGGWRRRSSLSPCRLRCSSLSSVSPRSSPGSTRFVVWTPLAWLLGHWLEGTAKPRLARGLGGRAGGRCGDRGASIEVSVTGDRACGPPSGRRRLRLGGSAAAAPWVPRDDRMPTSRRHERRSRTHDRSARSWLGVGVLERALLRARRRPGVPPPRASAADLAALAAAGSPCVAVPRRGAERLGWRPSTCSPTCWSPARSLWVSVVRTVVTDAGLWTAGLDGGNVDGGSRRQAGGPVATGPRRRGSGDQGQSTVVVIGVIGAAVAVLLGAVDLTRAVNAAHVARSAADLAALAAAQAAVRGNSAAAAVRCGSLRQRRSANAALRCRPVPWPVTGRRRSR